MGTSSFLAENSGLYTYLPISFNITNYRIFLSDGGPGCCTYGSYAVSTNKIRVFNVGFNTDIGSISSVNNSGYGGYIFAIGF